MFFKAKLYFFRNLENNHINEIDQHSFDDLKNLNSL